MNPNKLILDACCGGRHCWFDKSNPSALYVDVRRAQKGHISLRPNHSVDPDEVVDFRKMPFGNESFKLVLFDPPHILARKRDGIMTKRYGSLNRERWESDIKAGFDECWRVLEFSGVLIFKWSEAEIPLKRVLACIEREPLFGHKTTRGGTHWLCFMKLAEQN